MFRAPTGSSSPMPATPPRSHHFQSSLFDGSHPSTTPAGPPPFDLTDISTTPAGPPPSSRLGNSAAGSGRPSKPTTSRPSNNVFSRSLLQSGVNDRGADDAMDYMHDDQSMMQTDFDRPFKRSARRSDFGASARAFSGVPAALVEPDELVLGTEDILENLFLGVKEDLGQRDVQTRVTAAASSLDDLWRNKSPTPSQPATIGPGDQADPITKAAWVSSLLLGIHHPGAAESRNAFGGLRLASSRKPLPEVLLHWLQTHHNPWPRDFDEIRDFRPNPAAHERFWDVVFNLTLRGQLPKARQLLSEADFGCAYTALNDGSPQLGYHGPQLVNISRVVARASEILQKCPAVESGDWNVTGPAWNSFRSRVHHAVSDLEQFAEGDSADRDAGMSQSMSADNFNMPSVRNDGLSLSTMSRRAESRVPWTIYENLQALYGELLGMRQELANSSQDWLEAVIGTAVWWDGDEDGSVHDNLASSRRRQSRRSQTARLVDSEPLRAYQQQLSSSLHQVTAEDEGGELQVDPTSAVQVALTCVFEGDLEGFVGIVRAWSPTIASAVVEVAGYGGWLGLMQTASNNIADEFDESDLQVLQFAKKSDKRLQKDDILSHYAGLVSRQLELSAHGRKREGWQLAIQILGRLDNQQLSNEHIGRLLDKLEFKKGHRVEQAIALCNKLGLANESRKLSEQYADHLLQEARDFGDAILHYARAHQEQKLKDLVNMLVSYCLVTSSAWPPTGALDTTMQTLLSSPQAALAQLRRHDVEASQLLGHHFAGYATIRRFYALRDDDTALTKDATTSAHGRRVAAAKTLLASISSAADSVNGGRFDDSVHSVLEVDGLLVLLGEALPFISAFNPPKGNARQPRILSQSQILALIKAAEDISTAPAAVFSQCEACLASALAHANGADVATPATTLKKSLSSLTTSSYSLLEASAGTVNGEAPSNQSGSGVLVGGAHATAAAAAAAAQKRRWDWRAGLPLRAGGADVLRLLRLGLARELSSCWLDG